jgi:hypothetical protein
MESESLMQRPRRFRIPDDRLARDIPDAEPRAGPSSPLSDARQKQHRDLSLPVPTAADPAHDMLPEIGMIDLEHRGVSADVAVTGEIPQLESELVASANTRVNGPEIPNHRLCPLIHGSHDSTS